MIKMNTSITPNEVKQKRKCIQLTWKGVKYALKVVNGNNTVFEVSEESYRIR